MGSQMLARGIFWIGGKKGAVAYRLRRINHPAIECAMAVLLPDQVHGAQ
jgi:hypothetical protein